ncbi:unnamed protein product, partial [Mesorhabditis spiculigera]
MNVEEISAADLGQILEAERELVLKTQDNYRQLKQKFVELQERLHDVTQQNEVLLARQSNTEKLQQNFHILEQQSRALIQQASKITKDMIRYLLFRSTTLSELRESFKLELVEYERRLEEVDDQRQMLQAKNLKLEDMLREQRVESRKATEEWHDKERRLHAYFEEETAKSIAKLQTERAAKTSEASEHAEQYREEIRGLERSVSVVYRESMSARKMRQRFTGYKQHSQRQIACFIVKLRSSRKLNEVLLEGLQREASWKQDETRLLNDFEHSKKNMRQIYDKLEAEYTIMESRASDEAKPSRSVEAATDIEETAHLKKEATKRHENLEQKLEMERKRHKEELASSVARLEAETKSKQQLEDTIVTLKKKLTINPEAEKQLNYAAAQLLAKEEELKKTRAHYKELLKRMKVSLLNIERKYKKTQANFEKSIVF